MSPPRPIKGTIGSRIRVILGDDGNTWLLLLDNDDGNRKWQTKLWKSIPSGLANQINNCTAKGRDIDYVDFGPNDSWYVHGVKVDGSGGHCWWGGMDSEHSASIDEETSKPHPCKVALGSQDSRPSLCVITGNSGYHYINIPAQLKERIRRNNSRRKTVQMIRLFSNGGYYIEDDHGSQWGSLNNHLEEELRKNQKEEEVAVAGDGSWIVVRGDYFASSVDVDTELEDKIKNFFRQQRERNRNRQREITEYHDRERAEREAREAAERAAREEEQRRAEEERKRKEEEERAKKAAQESRVTALEVKLVEKLTQEKETIDKLETKLEVMQDHLEVMQDHFYAMQDHYSTIQDDLCSRKISLRESLVVLPPARRPRWDLGEDKLSVSKRQERPQSKRQEKPQCVICQDKAPVQAVVPCGHLCLCDDCAPSILQRPSNDRLCPLCRGPAPSTLRIYS